MSISDKEVQKLAELSRLDLSREQRDGLSDDLGEILELAEKVDEVDTEGVEPTYHALPLTNIFRSDEERPSPDAGKVLDHAPDSADQFFVVPGVIEEE